MGGYRRPLRAVAGLVVMLLASGGLLAGVHMAGAEEAEGPAGVTRQAYFTHPLTEIAPPVLFNGFPPSTACLVAGLVGVSQICGESIIDLIDPLGLSDGLPVPVTPDSEIIQPVVPGTTPVGMLGGQERYVSLMQFQLPPLPEGERFSAFEVTLRQEGLNFAIESPAFREIVLAAISQVSAQDPAVFTAILERIAAGDLSVVSESVTGIEACPIVGPWNGGDAQDAGIGGVRLPATDCILGTTGQFDPATNSWVFDLTFAAQAWTTGKPDGEVVPNEGILFRPLGAPNVAYGDPDLSTNFLISLADSEAAEGSRPHLRYATTPEVSTAAPAPSTGGSSSPPFVPSPGGGFTPGPAPAAPPAAAPGPFSFSARWADRASSQGAGDLPGWVVLLLPLGLAGVYLFGSSLAAEPAAIRHRPGALTRLVQRQDAAIGVNEGNLHP